MKKLVYWIGILSFLWIASSCTEKYKKEIERLTVYADSLESMSVEKDTSMMSYVRTFNAIQENLMEIKAKERLITEISDTDDELRLTKEEEINRDINAIYDLLLENRRMLDRLKSQFNASGEKNVELERMIANLSAQIEQKDMELVQLKHELADKQLAIENLEKDLDAMEALSQAKAELIEQQIVEKNTVWYLIGSKKYLDEQGVTTKEGGFIGIGSSRKVSETFDPTLFTRADLRDLTVLPVFSKKARLLSVHPAGSYEFIGEKSIDSLRILFPDDFWSASRYLVVMID
ncbi:MAG: hypothetical protein M0Q41_02205 [Bacteroidales bacterium]|nr:hypothetical protein [Bacteroidales bacterium]